MNLFFLPQADKLIAVSKRIRLDLIENFMVPKRKVMVIYNLKDKLDLVKKRKKTRNKIPVILYAGRLVKQKRVDLLIKAFAEVSKLIKARLLIIGEGPEKDRLKNLIKKLEMQGKIKMENFTLDLNKRLADVDLVVLSSIVEGCPNIIMESMTVGTLVLATKYPGAEELIKDGQTGFLVDLEVNPKQLAKEMIKAIKYSQKSQKIAIKAKQWVSKFDLKTQTLKYEKVFLS
jgi:glycosyltransferase involved in cell wall biosynthesis